MNRLHYGDNLDVLRASVKDESVDLVYLDPPFNSNAGYNILFAPPKELRTAADADNAQIRAFEDSWHWNDSAEEAFDQVQRSGATRAFDLLNAMRGFLGDNDMMAYLAMMAVRLIELHRVLKPTGSLYLHCDPTASHYLKLLLDGVFGKRNFRNEIVWCYRKWSIAQGQFARNHDVILFYSRDEGGRTFNTLYADPSPGTLRRWGGKRQQAVFEGGVRKATSIEEEARSPLPDWWDMSVLNPNSKERLGYPTQKPAPCSNASSPPPPMRATWCSIRFAGAGRRSMRAQKLGRRWIGIDVTHLAISLIEKRLKDAFPGIGFEVLGTPKDLASALDLARRDKYQFQWWAVSLVDAQPFGWRKKGADGGIDGLIYFKPDGRKTEKAIVSVKGGDNVGVQMIRELHSTMAREKAPIGIFITKALPTSAMEREAAAVGRFEDGFGRTFPRLQILTLAELFQGKKPDIPLVDPSLAFRRAGRERNDEQRVLL